MRKIVCSIAFSLAIVHCSLAAFCYAGQDTGFTQEEKVQKAREYYASGKALLAQGNYGGADEQFKKAQALLSHDSSISPNTASSSLRASEAREAISGEIACLPERQASPPAAPRNDRLSNALLVATKALEAAKRGASEEAISLYQEAINTSAPNANLYYNLSLEFLKAKRFKEAAQTLKKAIQLNPKDKDAYFNLAILYESYLNDKSQALAYYAQYLKCASRGDNSDEVKEWVRRIKKELKTR